jgi:REP element-mobilizing transposase RayT
MDVHIPLPNRRTARLNNFDYASCGAYFVTVCTYERACTLGDITNQAVVLTEIGAIVDQCWRAIPTHFPTATLDTHVVMPNHVHGTILLEARGGPTLGEIVRAFKARATVNTRRHAVAMRPIWQRNYYEHVIRNDADLNRIRQYIADNPTNWETDHENPAASV